MSAVPCNGRACSRLQPHDLQVKTLHYIPQNVSHINVENLSLCFCCRCGHEFCYCCGGEYREGQQSCTCDFWDDEKEEEYQENTIQELEQWPWDAFSSMPSVMDAYSEQERSQLALIQRFLAGGGFSISDHHTFYQSPRPQPPCRESSYVEAAMKDIHQLPWLERFVSVISDDYYEENINSQ